MQLGVHFINFTLPGGPERLGRTLTDTARAAEDHGCTKFTLPDHYFQVESVSTVRDPMLEGYTVLGFLAGQTSRMQLGLLVTGTTYRHPGLLAKIVTTLDIVSGGRAQLGLGAAWYEREHLGLGVPFPRLRERFERLEETLQICQQMWSDDDGPYNGKYYQLAETMCIPQPIQRPRPSILIGGGGEKKTLRMVAQYADACNIIATNIGEVRHKFDVLNQHCADLDRDSASIDRTISTSFMDYDDPSTFLRAMEEYAAVGVNLVGVRVRSDDPAKWVADFASRVVPSMAELGP
jgi:F420-dependent oxidoreductase-like protein